MGTIKLENQTVPATPSTGQTRIFVDSSTKTLKSVDDTGSVQTYGNTNGPYETLDLVTGLAHPDYLKGRLFWDETEDCPAYYASPSDVTVNIGQEIIIRCVNKTASPILNGTPVYISGAQGNRPKMDLARADTYNKAVKCLGLVTETSVAPNAYGYCTVFGLVHGLDTSAFTEGNEIWLGATGGLTNVKPSVNAGNCLIKIGDCVVSDNVDGAIFVHPIIYFTKFGNVDTGAFSMFDDNGILVLPKTSGSGIKVDPAAPTFGWKDLVGDITIRDTTNPVNPTYNVFRGGLRNYQFTVNDECFLMFHMPHDYVPGTDLHIHAHWSHASTTVTSGSVTWSFEVIYAKGHNQAAFSAPITTSVTQSASTTQYQHMIAEVQLSAASPSASQLNTSLLEVDGLIEVRCYLSANSMNGTPEPYLKFVDIHYQSTGIPTKNKAPNFYT